MARTETTTIAAPDLVPTSKYDEKRKPPVVGSNQGRIGNEHIRWLRPTTTDTPLEEMRDRLEQDGYLFVKNLLPREDVLKVRAEYICPFAK